MTKVLAVNCDKWSLIIKLTLWGLFTIGLASALPVSYNNMFVGQEYDPSNCTHYDASHYSWGCIIVKDLITFWIVLGSNVGNIIGIWAVINYKKRFIEIKCANDVKPNTYEWKDGFGKTHIISPKYNRTYPKGWESSL